MNAPNAQFIVSYIAEGEAGERHVIGRCGETPVAVGDVFRCVYRIQRPAYPSGLADPPLREPGERNAALQVKCIHAYGKSLHELGAGMSGSLLLAGDGLEYVTPGVMLGLPTPSSVESCT